jgi:hypothetical protein
MGEDDLPSKMVDYDGDFQVSSLVVGELAMPIYPVCLPGHQHMVRRRFKKPIFLAAQDASDVRHGGLVVMGHRILVHSNSYLLS